MSIKTRLHWDLFRCYSSLIYAHWHLVSVLFDEKKKGRSTVVRVSVCACVFCRTTKRKRKRDRESEEAVFLLDMKERGYWSNRSAVFRLSTNDGDGTLMRWQKELVFLSTDHRHISTEVRKRRENDILCPGQRQIFRIFDWLTKSGYHWAEWKIHGWWWCCSRKEEKKKKKKKNLVEFFFSSFVK